MLPIGDDAAVLNVDGQRQLVMTADLLVDGVHFPETTDPYAIGYKSLAVNLSDLAAMGAEPAWAVMTLSLPVAEPEWLSAFSAGFFTLAERFRVQLVGGDVARGPLSVGVHLTGMVPPGTALTRFQAQPGDDIYVSGSIGGAALGLMAYNHEGPFADEERIQLVAKLERPEPRVALGQRLRGIATAAIDLSDGLALDLQRLTQASQVSATVELAALPRHKLCAKYFPDQWEHALSGGDDYELCFTAPEAERDKLQSLSEELRLRITRVGSVGDSSGVEYISPDGGLYQPGLVPGYDHFADL